MKRVRLSWDVDSETAAAIDRLRADLNREIEAVRVELADTRSAITRHFDVVGERLCTDLRIIAQRFVALGAKVDAVRRPDGLG